MRAFRFGFQIGDEPDVAALLETCRRAEDAGFDVIHTSDHVAEGWSPLAPLVAVAAATSRVRLGPLVLNNDFHHPVHLAREIAAMDRLTGGRVELGLGAGHAFPEYHALGAAFDSPPVRKARLAEAVEILRRLIDGEEVTFHGEHYRIEGVKTMTPAQDHLPVLVGVNGRRALRHAARHADIIGLTMLGRTLEDGQRHEVNWASDRLDATVEHIRTSAGDRWDRLELNALVQSVVVTDDRRAAAAEIVGRIGGLTVEDALTTPFLALGTHEEIAEHLRRCRERWSISFFSVRDPEAFSPVIQRLRGSGP